MKRRYEEKRTATENRVRERRPMTKSRPGCRRPGIGVKPGYLHYRPFNILKQKKIRIGFAFGRHIFYASAIMGGSLGDLGSIQTRTVDRRCGHRSRRNPRHRVKTHDSTETTVERATVEGMPMHNPDIRTDSVGLRRRMRCAAR